MKPTLLLSSTPPGPNGVGSQYLEDALSCIDRAALWGVFPRPDRSQLEVASSYFLTNRCEFIAVPRELFTRKLNGKLGAIETHFAYRKKSLLPARGIIRRVQQLIDENQIKQVWAVLDSPLIYQLVRLLKLPEGCELSSTIWDPPRGICHSLQLDSFSKRNAEQAFDACLRKSKRLGVISEAMLESYQSKTDAKQFVIRHSKFSSKTTFQLDQCQLDANTFVIGFCGSLYASAEWDALLKALDTTRWNLDGRRIIVRVVGAKASVSSNCAANFEFFGYRSPDETRQILSTCHIGYVPYWFDPNFEESVRLCFPTKLTACLAAGLPILFHGPKYSGPARFVSQYQIGINCQTQDANGIVESLRAACNLTRNREAIQKRVHNALSTELNFENFVLRTRALLDVH